MLQVKQSVAKRVLVKLLNSVTGVPLTGVPYSSVSVTVVKGDGTTANLTLSSSSDWSEVTSGAFSGHGVYQLVIPSSATGVLGILGWGVSTAGADEADGFLDVVANLVSDTYTDVGAINTKLGTPAGASVSADIASVASTAGTINTRLGAPVGASHSADVAAISTKLGSPAGASVSADIASNSTAVAAVSTKLGTPAGASVSVDIAAVKTKADGIDTKLGSFGGGTTVSSQLTALRDEIEAFVGGKWEIDTGANQLILYELDGTTPRYTFDLKDASGVASSTEVFSRVPVP